MEDGVTGVEGGPRKRTGLRVAIVTVIVLAAGAAGLLLLRGRLVRGPATAGAEAGNGTGAEAEYSTVRVERGDILLTVPASGKLEPSSSQTVRPDPNMPTRRIIRLLVKEGDRVSAGAPLAQVDTSGLDLELESARATWEAQRIRLENLRAGPTDQELAAAEVDLRQAELSSTQARETLESTRRLQEKGLASRDQLQAAEREVTLADLRLEAQKIRWDDVRDGADEDAVRSQEASLAQAANAYQKAQLVWGSTTVRSPGAGVVTDLQVKVGDLAGASTALLTLAVMDPMVLTAMVDETDVKSVHRGQEVTVTLGSDADLVLRGVVTGVAVKAQTQSNVTVFAATIEVPNPEGRLLWGMNADSEIVVAQARDTLVLPLAAVTRSENTATVNIVDGGKLVAWEVRTGADDGSRIQILRGLDEGDEVAVPRRRTTTTTTRQTPQTQGGFGSAGMMFRAIR